MKFIKQMFKRLRPNFQMFSGASENAKGMDILKAQEYDRLKQIVRSLEPENPALFGYKVYSQTDEDGIIDAIFSTIGSGDTFVEIGVQTGVECNTMLLLLKGWRGTWIEGDPSACAEIGAVLGQDVFENRFRITNSFVTKDNIVALLRDAMKFLGRDGLDLLSVDIDGNDLYVLREVLTAKIPVKVVCVEYNGKFPPPIAVKVAYKHDRVWDSSDYMGSSLQEFVDLFSEFGYRLITCNIPGINAFFVSADLALAFPDVSVDRLYQPYRYYLSPMAPGHTPSLGYLRDALSPKER